VIDSAPEERALEAALRPKVLGEFVGQDKVVKQISLVIKAAKLGGKNSGSHFIGRASRARKNHSCDDRCSRSRANTQANERPSNSVFGGSSIDTLRSRGGRRAIYRRNPPNVQKCRRDAISRDGRFPGRRDGWQGPRRCVNFS